MTMFGSLSTGLCVLCEQCHLSLAGIEVFVLVIFDLSSIVVVVIVAVVA